MLALHLVFLASFSVGSCPKNTYLICSRQNVHLPALIRVLIPGTCGYATTPNNIRDFAERIKVIITDYPGRSKLVKRDLKNLRKIGQAHVTFQIHGPREKSSKSYGSFCLAGSRNLKPLCNSQGNEFSNSLDEPGNILPWPKAEPGTEDLAATLLQKEPQDTRRPIPQALLLRGVQMIAPPQRPPLRSDQSGVTYCVVVGVGRL